MDIAIDHLIADALSQPSDAIVYSMSRVLARSFPDKALIETTSTWSFDLEEFRNDGLCTLRQKGGVHSQFDLNWVESHKCGVLEAENTWFEVEWEGHRFDALLISYQKSGCTERRWFLLAESAAVGLAFFEAVSKWCTEIRGEVLVYSGHWYKDSDLFEAIKVASLEKLVLQGTLKEEIRDDMLSFFDCKPTYEKYGIPWKRGVLFLGSPGNGKTHAIKALINLLGKPCLYVKSFKARHDTDHGCIREVFQRARATAPCVLVLEDLDSLLDDGNRSFFLNEMDGFASNAGIMTIATTNHPERLDPAILDRPSRFDRKYTFHLPDFDCRKTYLKMCSDELEQRLRLDDEALDSLAAATEEFSFAYLKELFLSAMMQWITHPEAHTMGELMTTQVETLRTQMKTDLTQAEKPSEDDDNDFTFRYQSRLRR